MENRNPLGWNYQGYPSIIDQTNPMDEEEEDDGIDINFGPDPNQRDTYRPRSTQHSRYDWRGAAERHSLEAIKMGERLYYTLNLNDMTEEQDDILRLSILYGINSACCMSSKNLSPGHHMHEFMALDDIVADDDFDEEVLLEVIQNGLVSSSGFISNPARQWRGKKLYKHLEDLLNRHDNEARNPEQTRLEVLSNGIINIWLDNIENNDYMTFVCHNSIKKTIRQLFGPEIYGGIDKFEKRTPEHGGEAYTFREYWNYYYREQNETAQEVVDRWESSYISWEGILD